LRNHAVEHRSTVLESRSVELERAEAAVQLGISRRTLQYKIVRYGLQKLPRA